ncbi:hypothetical protein RD055328_02150 [Companilactobacillus sp. RD055328]|uniref:hypothetical protein n=1 Tax=Companilactobacillus sp. RD055328 TaxID=2916634 RepID=UPI001FC8C53F|nr:hypothetical protein [Companilactobacillus sp. RD055328]GKQ42292.1 hypothetical protein RD055328_02150 [Companilactobacillus sp. RD055328]
MKAKKISFVKFAAIFSITVLLLGIILSVFSSSKQILVTLPLVYLDIKRAPIS